MIKAPRKCIFCGENANSQEHIWPTWLHDLLGPPPDNVRHNRQNFSYHPCDGTKVTGPTDRQGDQRTIRIRTVCNVCNNGWMNRLEGEVRPILTPIITGEKTTLNRGHVETLSRWISLKVIIAENEDPAIALTPQVDRERFWKDGTIPEYFRLYVAHNIGEQQMFYLRHSHCVAYSEGGPNPPLDGTAKNVQFVTLVVGKAVIQAVCTRIAGVAMEERASIIGFHDRCRIWPNPDDETSFPRRPRLDEDSIERVATIFQRYIDQSNATWAD
ncbi:hypothetical protein [Alteraurantiacibacter aquimixticola]|uniref:HNH endonuclease n=1 Tax=Alteraurantiacibacter aquimixticola TaxID=2489173 RepID=A0A4T3EW83_9SPHN|nr:hypothetical protein [Alteraurantiacibacter aquimixticola]TIX48805.1 hypothetical protein E5222_13735 [Alteraurantiacibacter aquimixticola]